MKSLSKLAAAILVLAFAIAGCSHETHQLYNQGWVTLIDGDKGMENWTIVGGANWRAVDGAIQADKTSAKGSSFLLSKNAYKDFEIRVEFWASPDANSGIYMRCADRSKITDRSCYEANIFDQRPDPSYGTGAIMHLAVVSPMPKAGGKWNVYEITARGPHLTVVLNGAVTAYTQDKQFASGPIALQWGRGTIKFRKVQIRPL